MLFGVTYNTWALLAVALIQLVTLYYTRRTEQNTNHLMDARLAEARVTSEVKGNLEGRAEAHAETGTKETK